MYVFVYVFFDRIYQRAENIENVLLILLPRPETLLVPDNFVYTGILTLFTLSKLQELTTVSYYSMGQARYNTYGELNAAKDNLLIVCHALTGNSRLDQWWGTMLGEFIH